MFAYAPHLFPLIFSDGTFSEPSIYNGEDGNPYNFLNESGYQKQWNAYIQSKISLNQKLDFITQGLSLKLSGRFPIPFSAPLPNMQKSNYTRRGIKRCFAVRSGRKTAKKNIFR